MWGQGLAPGITKAVLRGRNQKHEVGAKALVHEALTVFNNTSPCPPPSLHQYTSSCPHTSSITTPPPAHTHPPSLHILLPTPIAPSLHLLQPTPILHHYTSSCPHPSSMITTPSPFHPPTPIPTLPFLELSKLCLHTRCSSKLTTLVGQSTHPCPPPQLAAMMR